MSSNGSLDVEEDLILTSGSLNGANSSNINIAGDLLRTSGTLVVNATTNNIIFDGTTQQAIDGDFTGGNSFSGLEINNTSGLTILNGGNDIEIDGELTFTNGTITTDSDNTLTINSSGSSSEGNSSSYVNGPLTKNNVSAGDNFIFHIGSGNRYALAGIDNVNAGEQNWTAQFFTNNANSSQPINAIINLEYSEMVEITSNGSWNIEASGVNEATIILGIQPHLGVVVPSDVRVAEYDKKSAGEWVNLGGVSAGSASDGTITSQDIGNFSSTTFTLGGVNVTALPVELISFDGVAKDNTIILSWSTASEINLILFPNPTSAQDINIRLTSGDQNSPISVVMYHMTGALVHNEILEPILGTHDYKINVDSNLPSGIYHVVVIQGANKSLNRVIVR